MRRRGIAIWVVLSVAVVMGVLLFSFNLVVRQRNAQAHAVYFGERAKALAESALELAWLSLRKECTDEGSAIYKTLTERPCSDLIGMSLPITLNDEAVEELTKNGGGSLDATITVKEAALLADTITSSLCEDPLEKRLSIEVRAGGEYRGLSRTLTEVREVLVQSDLLPLLSKFSLFVKEPEKSDSTSPGYNVYANDINGKPDTVNAPGDKNYLPLVLYNHGDTLAKLSYDLDENGWVYLGGNQDVQLNLTSGADYQYGQYFHFYDFLEADQSKQAAFINDEPPSFFNSTYSYNGTNYEFFLKHVIYGYFTIDAGNPAGSMNKNGMLDRYFADGTTMRSSVLHLYGSAICPSPTRVFGQVFQSYPIYSGVTVDVDGDKKRDGLVTLLPAIDDGEFSAANTKAQIPSSISNLTNKSASIEIDTATVNYENMFGDESTYLDYMSTLIDSEPYNRSIDYMMAKGEFPPKSHFLDEDTDYPNDGGNVKLEVETNGYKTTYFSGDLDDIDSSHLKGRSFLHFDSADAFKAACVKGSTLSLNNQVYVKSGELELPDNLQVEKGGVIICEDSIKFDGITCQDGERLALVSLQGNITSNFANSSETNPAEVSLVALNGRVGSTEKLHPFCIKGTVAAKELNPKDFQAGGSILYPLSNNPTAATRSETIKVHLADLASVWSF